MCTAYKIGNRQGSLPDDLKATAIAALRALADGRIIRPTHRAPVILPDGELTEMTWGFRCRVRGAAGKMIERTVVNSREDKLQSRTWKKAFEDRRCLIPAAAFFEWTGEAKHKVPLRFESPDDTWLWIAGIWEEDAERGQVFSMITTEPNPVVAPVHDRMPAVLAAEQVRPFLRGDLKEFGPSRVPLRFEENSNFLTGAPSRRRVQGDLFQDPGK